MTATILVACSALVMASLAGVRCWRRRIIRLSVRSCVRNGQPL